MNDIDERKLQDLARYALEQDAAALDDGITTQLRAARLSALAALRSRRRLESVAGWGLAAGVVLAMNAWWWQSPSGADVSVEDFDMLVSGEYIELYDDMDFYDWMGGDNDAS